jgi:hypothetical protein
MRTRNSFLKLFQGLTLFFLMVLSGGRSWAQTVTMNVLAVNGTDTARNKEVEVHLPPELAMDDILDTDGLELDYDVAAASYVVRGKVDLAAKESHTFKLRVRDVWKISPEDVQEIREQIDESVKRVEGTEYAEASERRKTELLKRLDFILQEQERNADNVDRRVSSYRSYAGEFKQIRENAVSVSYWRTPPPQADEKGTINLVLKIGNPTESRVTVSPKHYLPVEVKPEHVIEYEGFELTYDPIKKQSYLVREETLGPGETRNYSIVVANIWRVPGQKIENLRIRSREAYKFLEGSIYGESALYLIRNIKEKLDRVELSQSQDREIKEHISAFRVNTRDFESAQSDVEALENLLMALREELERSKLRNVLQRIKELRSVADIAEAVFGTKPAESNAWRIIIGIVIFVGAITFIHFMIWGRRSRAAKLKAAQRGKNA